MLFASAWVLRFSEPLLMRQPHTATTTKSNRNPPIITLLAVFRSEPGSLGWRVAPRAGRHSRCAGEGAVVQSQEPPVVVNAPQNEQ